MLEGYILFPDRMRENIVTGNVPYSHPYFQFARWDSTGLYELSTSFHRSVAFPSCVSPRIVVDSSDHGSSRPNRFV